MTTPNTATRSDRSSKKKAAKRSRWRPIPVLKPGIYSADMVLAALIALIREDQRRLYMGDWITLYKGRKEGSYYADRVLDHDKLMPPCGTVACAAGHLAILTRTVGETMKGCSMGTHALNLNAYSGLEGVSELRVALYSLFQSGSAKPREVLSRLREIRNLHSKVLKLVLVTVPDRPLPTLLPKNF
jgi:hypothetical protein